MCPLYLLPGALPLDVSLACTSSLGLYPWMRPLYILPGALPLDVYLVPSPRGFTLRSCSLFFLPGALPLDLSLVPPPRGFTLRCIPCTASTGPYPWMCPLYLLPGALPLDVSLVPPPRSFTFGCAPCSVGTTKQCSNVLRRCRVCGDSSSNTHFSSL